jgi:putative tryptophan/tyrosine transport system substrate-binding protein
MSYGRDFIAQWRQATDYTDRILRGAQPADLPVEQPTTFEFVINARSAQALGLTIPADMAGHVTEWIE